MRRVVLDNSATSWAGIPSAAFTAGGQTCRSGFGLLALYEWKAATIENWGLRRVVLQNETSLLPPVAAATCTSGGTVCRGGFGSIAARRYATAIHRFSVQWNIGCGSALQIGYAYFAGDLVAGWLVTCGTEVLFIPEGSAPELAIQCGTDVLFFPRAGGLWNIECGTQVNWGLAASNRVATLNIGCGTTVEFYPERGRVSGSWPIYCGTKVQFFPLLRAVTPGCLTVSEAPPAMGGIQNYAL